jgi:hypothetical protein
MFQTPQLQAPPRTPAPSRALATTALTRAGLMDKDSRMHDAPSKQGGKKLSSRIRSHRPRLIDTIKDPGPSRNSVNLLFLLLDTVAVIHIHHALRLVLPYALYVLYL